jgi:hypothetical protein
VGHAPADDVPVSSVDDSAPIDESVSAPADEPSPLGEQGTTEITGDFSAEIAQYICGLSRGNESSGQTVPTAHYIG